MSPQTIAPFAATIELAAPTATRLANKELGALGETMAANFLTSQGYIVLDRNWATPRYGRGELDLVCRRGSDLVVVEVKTRRSHRFGHPSSAVTRTKLDQLRRLTGAWLAQSRWQPREVRIDVIAIVLAPFDELAPPPGLPLDGDSVPSSTITVRAEQFDHLIGVTQ